MRSHLSAAVVLLASCVAAAVAGCGKEGPTEGRSEAGPVGDAAVAQGVSFESPKPSARPAPSAPAEPSPVPTGEGLVEVTPRPIPEGMPSCAKVTELPAGAIRVTRAWSNGTPMTFTLEADTVIGGVPCAKHDGEELTADQVGVVSSCRLAFDFTLAGIDLKKGTRVVWGPTGVLQQVELAVPQRIRGIPIKNGKFIELTPPPNVVPAVAPLAAEHEVFGIVFPPGSVLQFDVADPAHPLARAVLSAPTTVGGRTVPGGAQIDFDAQGRVAGISDVARSPDSPIRCPATPSVTVEFLSPDGPPGFSWTPVPSTAVEHNFLGPTPPFLAARSVTVILSNAGSGIDRPSTVELSISRLREGLRAGKYALSDGASEVDYAFRPRIRIPEAETDGIVLDAATAEGNLEITLVGGYRLCGRFDFRDARLHARGEFAAWSPPERRSVSPAEPQGISVVTSSAGEPPVPASVRWGSPARVGGRGTLDRAAFDEAFRAKKWALKVCFDRARAQNPEVRGELFLLLTVDERGRVRPEVDAESTGDRARALEQAGVVECILQTLRTMDMSANPARGGDFVIRLGAQFLAP